MHSYQFVLFALATLSSAQDNVNVDQRLNDALADAEEAVAEVSIGSENLIIDDVDLSACDQPELNADEAILGDCLAQIGDVLKGVNGNNDFSHSLTASFAAALAMVQVLTF